MHILFVWPYLHYPEVAIEFLQRVRDRGHKASVLLAKMDGALRAKFFSSGIDFYFVPSFDIVSWFTQTPYPVFRSVSTCVKAINPDVIHVNSHLFLCNYQVVRAAYSMKVPSVVTVHGFMAERGFVLNALQEIYLRLVGREIFRRASAVVCLTKEDAKSVTRILGDYSNVLIIPNGVDVELFKPSSIKDSNLITWVGRFVPEKGLVYLLKAMKRVIRDCCDARLVLIGDGPVKSNLISLSKEFGLDGNVFFLKAMDRGEVARWLSKSSIFVFPSLREGLPMALLEAMSSGNAVIAADISGVRELIQSGRNGLLFPVGDVDTLASDIVRLLREDELRERLSENAVKTVRKDYSINVLLERLENVWRCSLDAGV